MRWVALCTTSSHTCSQRAPMHSSAHSVASFLSASRLSVAVQRVKFASTHHSGNHCHRNLHSTATGRCLFPDPLQLTADCMFSLPSPRCPAARLNCTLVRLRLHGPCIATVLMALEPAHLSASRRPSFPASSPVRQPRQAVMHSRQQMLLIDWMLGKRSIYPQKESRTLLDRCAPIPLFARPPVALF